MMDLAKIGQVLMTTANSGWLKPHTGIDFGLSAVFGETGASELFCHYGAGLQAFEVEGSDCDDTLFGSRGPWLGHPGEAYGLLSGLWVDNAGTRGFVYFTTESPPPPGGEDTGNFTPGEKALMARAMGMVGEIAP